MLFKSKSKSKVDRDKKRARKRTFAYIDSHLRISNAR